MARLFETWLFLLSVAILSTSTFGCAASKYYSSSTVLGGTSLEIHDEGTFELTSYSDVVTENCVYSGRWSSIAGSDREISLIFEGVRNFFEYYDECGGGEGMSIVGRRNSEIWELYSNKVISPRGGILERAAKRRPK